MFQKILVTDSLTLMDSRPPDLKDYDPQSCHLECLPCAIDARATPPLPPCCVLAVLLLLPGAFARMCWVIAEAKLATMSATTVEAAPLIAIVPRVTYVTPIWCATVEVLAALLALSSSFLAFLAMGLRCPMASISPRRLPVLSILVPSRGAFPLPCMTDSADSNHIEACLYQTSVCVCVTLCSKEPTTCVSLLTKH